jgi:hypothetical protein
MWLEFDRSKHSGLYDTERSIKRPPSAALAIAQTLIDMNSHDGHQPERNNEHTITYPDFFECPFG